MIGPKRAPIAFGSGGGGQRKSAKKPDHLKASYKKRSDNFKQPLRKSAKSSYDKITPDRDAPAKTMRGRKEKETKDIGPYQA